MNKTAWYHQRPISRFQILNTLASAMRIRLTDMVLEIAFLRNLTFHRDCDDGCKKRKRKTRHRRPCPFHRPRRQQQPADSYLHLHAKALLKSAVRKPALSCSLISNQAKNPNTCSHTPARCPIDLPAMKPLDLKQRQRPKQVHLVERAALAWPLNPQHTTPRHPPAKHASQTIPSRLIRMSS